MKVFIRIIFLSTVIVLFYNNCFAQNDSTSSANVGFAFCNNGESSNELDIIGKAGEDIELCVEFTNSSKENISINVDFLDAVITQDTENLDKESKNRACNAADRPKISFGNYLKNYENTISLKGGESIKKKFYIRFPVGFKGLSHGCLAYSLSSKDQNNGNMFNIVIRSIKFIDIYIGESEIKSQINIDGIKTNKTKNGLNIDIGLKNIGNVDQKIEISGIISNIFGFSKKIEFNKNSFFIRGGESEFINIANNRIILPFYKGFFKIKLKITNKPNFSFDITGSEIPDKIIEGGTFNHNKIIFISNRYFILGLFFFFFIIYLGRIKKIIKKN